MDMLCRCRSREVSKAITPKAYLLCRTRLLYLSAAAKSNHKRRRKIQEYRRVNHSLLTHLPLVPFVVFKNKTPGMADIPGANHRRNRVLWSPLLLCGDPSNLAG